MLNAVRMLSDKSGSVFMTGAVSAKLVATITYTRWDGLECQLDAGSPILVDLVNGVATSKDKSIIDHFTIESDEYELDFPN